MSNVDRRFRRRCAELLDQLGAPRPFRIETLCAHLGRTRGRAVVPVPLTADRARPSGAWIATSSTDYICYESQTPPVHQLHIVLHELGHIMLGHHAVDADQDLWNRLFPHLDPGLVKMIMTRTAYSTVQEQQAEIFADTAHAYGAASRPAKRRTSTHLNPEVAATVDRLSTIMEPAVGRR